jgi:hypothetical protein
MKNLTQINCYVTEVNADTLLGLRRTQQSQRRGLGKDELDLALNPSHESRFNNCKRHNQCRVSGAG